MSSRGPNSGQSFRVTDGEAARFATLVEKGDGCWLWKGRIGAGGYGVFNLAYRKGPTNAHRVAYAIANGGKLSAGMSVCHRCDNPPCVRPDHLFGGTHLQNMVDMRMKGREGLHIPGPRCSNGHLFTPGNTIDVSGTSNALMRACVICRLKEDQDSARKTYYNALAEYRKHVDERILPVLPPESVAREVLTHREFDIVSRTLGVYGRDPEYLGLLGYIHGVSRQRIEQIRDAAFGRIGVPLDLIDWAVSHRFGLAASSINTVPARRRRKAKHVRKLEATEAA